MKLREITTSPPRDEYIDGYASTFDHAEPVASIRDLILKKAVSPTEINFGLFDARGRLVGFMSLEYRGNDIWEVTLVQLAQAYKGQGYGTFLYDYAVLDERLKIMSDATNTGGPHGSRALWLRLKDNGRYRVIGYDTKTRQEIPDAAPSMIYDNRPNTRWLALPPGTSINESLSRIQREMKNRWIVWYGPGTTTEEYFNY